MRPRGMTLSALLCSTITAPFSAMQHWRRDATPSTSKGQAIHPPVTLADSLDRCRPGAVHRRHCPLTRRLEDRNGRKPQINVRLLLAPVGPSSAHLRTYRSRYRLPSFIRASSNALMKTRHGGGVGARKFPPVSVQLAPPHSGKTGKTDAEQRQRGGFGSSTSNRNVTRRTVGAPN